jgi:hypothetical protein
VGQLDSPFSPEYAQYSGNRSPPTATEKVTTFEPERRALGMLKGRGNAPTAVSYAKFTAERRKKIGMTAVLLNSQHYAKYIRANRTCGTITNAVIGAGGTWMYELRLHGLPPQGSGYSGPTMLQVKEGEILLGGVCPHQTFVQ